MTYQEKLLDPRWQKRKAEVCIAHNFTCEDCGAKDRTLSVHHCCYIRDLEPWEYGDDLLMCLCLSCHWFRQGREEALHVALAQALRLVSIDELEAKVWDDLYDHYTRVAKRERGTVEGLDFLVHWNPLLAPQPARSEVSKSD